MNCGGLGTVSFVHEVAALLLLPLVVNVGLLAWRSKSHGAREARFPTTRSHPGAERQHHVSRVSVLGLFHGNWSSVASGGFAGNAFHRAR
jgi:hypothetical protein